MTLTPTASDAWRRVVVEARHDPDLAAVCRDERRLNGNCPGLAQTLGQLEAVNRDLQSKCWAKSRNPVQFSFCAAGCTIRCVWRYRHHSPVKDWRFPFKLSQNGADIFKHSVEVSLMISGGRSPTKNGTRSLIVRDS